MSNNYLNKLKDAVYDRFDSYGVADVDKYNMWTHTRVILSLHLKRETGEGLVKGNKPIVKEQYELCLKYLDRVLPEYRI